MLAGLLFSRLVHDGYMQVIDASGRTHHYAAPGADRRSPDLILKLHDRRLHSRLLFSPSLAFGEAYMDGSISFEGTDLYGALAFLIRNLMRAQKHPIVRIADWFAYERRFWDQHNPTARAQRNVAHHYDLSYELFRLFLDSDMQYSCAYFSRPDMDLDAAQEAKKRLIAAKLLLRPGQRVLDIGSGWGGLALHLAKHHGVDVTGLTLSAEQQKVAEQRARSAGLGERVRFLIRDYREERGGYDRIVSVGMFEHVGTPHYDSFFAKLRDLLVPDGVSLIHSIGRSDGPGATNPWIKKYIFPGGYSPATSEVIPSIERAGLFLTDIEILRQHYAITLQHWRRRFAANRERVLALYDERFYRMWEFYLTASELAFDAMGHAVLQFQLARRQDAVPSTRDYLWAWRNEDRRNAA
jgi:cyclopropane-fatty-acyl-phospholipid synthase